MVASDNAQEEIAQSTDVLDEPYQPTQSPEHEIHLDSLLASLASRAEHQAADAGHQPEKEDAFDDLYD